MKILVIEIAEYVEFPWELLTLVVSLEELSIIIIVEVIFECNNMRNKGIREDLVDRFREIKIEFVKVFLVDEFLRFLV